jgi:hypothetical protein
LHVDTNVLEKHIASISRAEMVMEESRGIYIGSEEGNAEERANKPSPPLTLEIPPLPSITTSQHHHFSSEDGDSMFYETLASTCKSTWRQNPQQHHPHHHENLKSHFVVTWL